MSRRDVTEGYLSRIRGSMDEKTGSSHEIVRREPVGSQGKRLPRRRGFFLLQNSCFSNFLRHDLLSIEHFTNFLGQ